MRGEIILLVAGLAVVAALPVQEPVPPSSQSDLLKILLSANPEENDLKTTSDEKPSVTPTKMEMVKQQPRPLHQDPPQSLPQDSLQEQPQVQDTPQEQPQVQDTPQEQPHVQDTPQEQPQVQDTRQEQPQVQDTPQEQPHVQDTPQEQPQAQDTPQEQPQSQDPEMDQEEPSFPYVSEDEVPSEDSRLEAAIWPEPQPILVYLQEENLPYEPEEAEGDELNSDLEAGKFFAESDNGYVVLQGNEEQPSLDMEDTFMYGVKMTPLPFNQEEEPLMFDLEEDDSEEEALSFEPQMDSLPFEPEESQMKPLSVESQDTLPYDSGELFDSNPQMDSFPLDEESIESDYEQLSQEIEEIPLKPDDYDYEFPMEEDQPAPENTPVEESYYEPEDDTSIDLFSWFVPDFFDEESTDYDESPYITSYHDDMIDQDPFANKPEMHFEYEVLDQTTNWKEPSDYEGSDDSVHSYDSFLEDETVLPHEVEESTEEDGDVSLAAFFIPRYDAPAFANIPQKYFDTGNPEDGSAEIVSVDEENYSVDDGHMEPAVIPYHIDVERDQPDMEMFGDDILFPENPSFDDEGYIFQWPAEHEEDQTEYLEEEQPVTILETQPTYLADVETDMTSPSLQYRLQEELAGDGFVESLNSAWIEADRMTESGDEDDEILDMEGDYASNNLANDIMDIIVVKDPRENYDNFPVRPLADDIDQGHPIPIVRYTEDQLSVPYWMMHRVPDQQFPKIYFSVTNERPWRKIPAFFDRMDEDKSFSPPPFHRSLKTPVMRNSFTLLNEVLDDDLPPQYLASPSPSRRLRFGGPDTLSSPRNYPDSSKNPKFSFRDLLQHLNPSFYENTHFNNMVKQSSPPYHPQTYNSMQHYNGLPQQFRHTSPPLPYSSPFDSFQGRDYSPNHNYYNNKAETLSFYSSNNEPSSLFREDTMLEMHPRQPLRHFDDYTVDLPFMSSDSFSSPRPRFPFFQNPQYSTKSLAYKRPYYSQNNFYEYGMGPYHPTPIYHRYAPDYY